MHLQGKCKEVDGSLNIHDGTGDKRRRVPMVFDRKKNKYSERSDNALRPVGLGLRMVMRDEMTVIPRILLTDDRWYVEDDCVC